MDSLKAISILSGLYEQSKDKDDIQLSLAARLLYVRYHCVNSHLYKNVIDEALAVIKEAEANDLEYTKAEALQIAAIFYWETKDYSNALEYFINAHNLYSHYSIYDFPRKAECLYDLGGKYYYFTDYKTAKNYFLEIYRTIPHNKIENILTTTVNTIALCYSNLQQYDSSGFYFHVAMNIATKKNDEVWMGNLSGNIAGNYYMQGNYDAAIPLFEKDAELSLKNGALVSAAYSLNILGEIYRLRNERKKALEYQVRAHELMNKKVKRDNYRILSNMYPLIAKTYAANGIMDKAYMYLDSGFVAKDSLNARRNMLYITGAQHKMDTQKHMAELQVKEAQIKKQEIVRNSFIAGFILVMLLLFFVFRNYNNQRIANRKLKEAQKQVIEHEKMAAFGVMATRVAHEIENPLNFVNNFSELSTELVNEIVTADNQDERKEAAKILAMNLQKITYHGKRADNIIKKLQEHIRSGTAHHFFEDNTD